MKEESSNPMSESKPPTGISRREFIKGIGATGIAVSGAVVAGSTLLSALMSPAHASTAAYAPIPAPADPWSELPAILARIKAPVFPEREFDVTKFGARGDNRTDCTEAFQKAIAACHAAGGGRVVISAGEFSTGAIR